MIKVKAKTPVRYKEERYETGKELIINEKDMNKKVFELIEEIKEEEDILSKLKVEELKELAKEREIEGYSNMKKDELIQALKG